MLDQNVALGEINVKPLKEHAQMSPYEWTKKLDLASTVPNLVCSCGVFSINNTHILSARSSPLGFSSCTDRLSLSHSFNGLSLAIMRWFQSLLWLSAASSVVAQSTQGIYNLVQRRLPNHADSFQFSLVNVTQSNSTYDRYTVSTAPNGKVLVQGNTLSALSTGYAVSSPI
jgi:hypothetical protein